MSDIQLNLEMQGQDANTEMTFSLQDWIQQEKISGLKQIQAQYGESVDGKMGIDPITAISVILASKAVVELVKAIHVWIQESRPRLKVKIHLAEGASVEIDAENLPESEQIISQILEKIDSLEKRD